MDRSTYDTLSSRRTWLYIQIRVKEPVKKSPKNRGFLVLWKHLLSGYSTIELWYVTWLDHLGKLQDRMYFRLNHVWVHHDDQVFQPRCSSFLSNSHIILKKPSIFLSLTYGLHINVEIFIWY